jgi:hypothetical protein
VTEVVGTAVLRDFPLRVWARSRQHSDEIQREFMLMLEGERSGQTSLDVPQALVDLANMVTTQFGPLLDQLYAAREQALAEGRDRMDSEVALVAGTPELLSRVREVMDAVDEYCRSGDLLALERDETERALLDWTLAELVAQYEGREPTAWPGPF